MSQVAPEARSSGSATEASAAESRAALTGPVVVVTYPHAGGELLTQTLSASRSLACTTATGLLPLCHEAVATWRHAGGTGGLPSPLAIKSVRALATTIITVIQARAGGRRWCETAFASTDVARTFLQVFPATTFLCLHRSMQGLFSEAAHAYPWGLGDSPFWSFSVGHPGNNAATIAAYWVNRSSELLEFEAAFPDSSLRVRYEDLAADRGQRASEIFAALGLDPGDLAVLREPVPRGAAPFTDPGPLASASRIPPQLLESVRDLHAKLAYDPWPQ